MKPTTNISKNDAFQDMENIVRTLKKAGDLYRNSRERMGIYTFLHAAYAVYWLLKRRGSIGQQKKLLRLATGISSSPLRRLSDLVLIVAAQNCDRRDRHRWKKLIEVAFQRLIHPRDLVKDLQAAHGVNEALKLWCKPKPHAPAPQSMEPSVEVHESKQTAPPDVPQGCTSFDGQSCRGVRSGKMNGNPRSMKRKRCCAS